jgi:DNA uptake protein ComE-like DNA-binding protein
VCCFLGVDVVTLSCNCCVVKPLKCNPVFYFFIRHLRNYFYFNRQDRNGIILLVTAIVVSLAGHVVVDRLEIRSSNDFSAFEAALKNREEKAGLSRHEKSWFAFDPNEITEERLDSLDIPVRVKKNLLKYRAAGGRFDTPEVVMKIYGMTDSLFVLMKPFLSTDRKAETVTAANPEVPVLLSGTFDPNTTSATVLYRFGFNRFQASNLIRYRESGGYLSRPEELMKIYGVDSAFFQSVKSHIVIRERQDMPDKQQVESFDSPVELNSADSLQLVRLRGIGPVFAVRILKYRALLGGFHSPRQLMEVYGFPRETFMALREKICVDATRVKKIRINFADYSGLIRHPYIKKDLVEDILDYREGNGPFDSGDQLLEAGLTDSATFVLLAPYLTCR